MITHLKPGFLARALLLAAFLPSCWQVLDERAALDEQVGQGHAGGVGVQVVDGLAAITDLRPGELTVWTQSPSLRILLEAAPSAPVQWRVTVRNAMQGSSMRGMTAEEDAVEIQPMPDDEACPTRKSWTVSLPPGQRAVVTIVPPQATEPVPLYFGVVNDPHGAEKIGRYIPLLNADARLSFVVSAGDVSGAFSGEAMRKVQEILCHLRVPFYATPGNTESGEGTAWHEVFGRHSFHFTHGGVAFSFADSSSASISPTVYRWLDGWLEGARAMPHVFITHVPPLDPIGSRNAGFRSRSEAGKLLSRLARGGVDFLICGHLHNFHQLSEGGIPTLISGGGHGLLPHAVVGVDPRTGVIQAGRSIAPRQEAGH